MNDPVRDTLRFPPPPEGSSDVAAGPSAPAAAGVKLAVVIAATVAALIVGVGVGIVSQSGRIKAADEATATAQAATTAIQGRLTTSEQANSDLKANVTDQQDQLDACSTANSLSVDMDEIQHKLIDNALNYGSLTQWQSLQAQYSDLGHQWSDAANLCDPSGDYTFD